MSAADFGICWSCQKTIKENSAVWIDENESISCCKSCWAKIPVKNRMEIAMEFLDRSDRGLGIEETLSAIRDLIHSATGNYIDRRVNDDEGRMN